MHTLKNVSEEIVTGLVGFFLRGVEYQTFCNCDQCQREISAYALNQLPPHYAANEQEREKLFKALNTEENMEVINREIIHAIHHVGKVPGHQQ